MVCISKGENGTEFNNRFSDKTTFYQDLKSPYLILTQVLQCDSPEETCGLSKKKSRENGLNNLRERITNPWEHITYPCERM